MPRIINRPDPRARFAELHPWTILTGHPCNTAECSHCGAGLVRSVVIADNGSHWGRDCYATAHPAEADLVRRPRITKKDQRRAEALEAQALARIARLEARYPGARQAALDGDDTFEPRRAMMTMRRHLQGFGWQSV